jgi:hypothetical protein
MGLRSSSGLGYAADMRDRIRQRLREYRREALHSIAIAEDTTGAAFSERGRSGSGMFRRAINRDNENGFAEYMDQSIAFIRHVAPGSLAEYADELWDGGNTLKQEIMAKIDHVNRLAGAVPEHSTRVQLRNDLEAALDSLIKRKVEDFELGFFERREMSPTTQNTVNIINSNISNAVVEINQSGRDTLQRTRLRNLSNW